MKKGKTEDDNKDDENYNKRCSDKKQDDEYDDYVNKDGDDLFHCLDVRSLL